MSNLIQKRQSTLALRVIKEIDDYGFRRIGPVFALVVMMSCAIGWYSLSAVLAVTSGEQTEKNSHFSYSRKAIKQLYLNLFGGEVVFDKAYKVYDSLDAFELPSYNAFDIAAINLYTTATSYRKTKFEEILKRPNGRVRVLVLDPRIAYSADTMIDFSSMSKKFGDPAEITLAECILSTIALIEAKKDLAKYGDRFQVRFYSKAHLNAPKGYFISGRSYHKYSTANNSMRFDMIVPYGEKRELKIDSGLRQTYLIKNDPENLKVIVFTSEFEEMWKTATPISEVAKDLPSLTTLKVPKISAEER